MLEDATGFLLDGARMDGPKGAFVLAPRAVHDVRNAGDVRAGLLGISAPGGFEAHMRASVDGFAQHPPGCVSG